MPKNDDLGTEVPNQPQPPEVPKRRRVADPSIPRHVQRILNGKVNGGPRQPRQPKPKKARQPRQPKATASSGRAAGARMRIGFRSAMPKGSKRRNPRANLRQHGFGARRSSSLLLWMLKRLVGKKLSLDAGRAAFMKKRQTSYRNHGYTGVKKRGRTGLGGR